MLQVKVGSGVGRERYVGVFAAVETVGESVRVGGGALKWVGRRRGCGRLEVGNEGK